MAGSVCQWPLPSQAGLHERSFRIGELPSIGQDWSSSSQCLAQLLSFTPKRLPLTAAEDTPNLLGETHMRGMKSARRNSKTTQPQGHQHVLDDKRHLVSPPGPAPSKSVLQQQRSSTHSLSFLHSAWSFCDLFKAASLLATLGAF